MDFSSISAPKQLEFLAPGPTPRFRCTYSRPPRTRLCLILRHTWRKSSWRPCGGRQAAKRRAAWSCCASWAVLRAPGATVSVVTLIMACCAPARSPSRPDVAVKRWIFTDFDGLFEGFWMISGLKPRCETLFSTADRRLQCSKAPSWGTKPRASSCWPCYWRKTSAACAFYAFLKPDRCHLKST